VFLRFANINNTQLNHQQKRKEWAMNLVMLVSWTIGAAVAAQQSDGEQAAEILRATGAQGGLIVHVGCDDGALTAAFHAGGRFLVHGLTPQPANVEAARLRIQALGLYGPVSVDRLSGPRLPYADNLVNLVVVEDAGLVPLAEVRRVLAPLGVAYYVREGGQWKKTFKPWPAEIDEWTHWLHGADGNAVARDRRVGPPRHVQWVERPLWQRHHEMPASISALVSAQGRIFYLSDEAPATASGMPERWMLIARDAFNGLRLWARPLGKWGWQCWNTRETHGRFGMPIHIARRLVAAGDRVYVTLDFNGPVTALDAATGKVIMTYEGTAYTDEILYCNGLLILSVAKAPQLPGRFSDGPPVPKEVVALQAESGKILWRRGDYLGIASMENALERFTHLSLTAGGEQIYLLEEDAVVCLAMKTGKELWRWFRPPKTDRRGHIPYKPGNLCALVAAGDIVLFAQAAEPYTRATWNRSVKCELTALAAKTGKPLWSRECGKWGPCVQPDLFLIDGLVWTHAAEGYALLGIDLANGEVKREFSTQWAFSEAHHHRCFRNKATELFILTARRGIEFLDLAAERSQKHHWVRGVCRYGIMPCNGLVYVPPHPCQCYIQEKLNGFFALAAANGKTARSMAAGGEDKTSATARGGEGASAADAATSTAAANAARLERGPAYHKATTAPHNAATDEWPTYRHDARRSGSNPVCVVPDDLAPRWETAIGGRPSATTIANGTLFVADIDGHRVRALAADTGKLRWSFTAGGRVDTPPTIYQGLALFGSADGWVYAVDAADGRLAWRFRAAPQERRILAFGQLESPWPVHGTVLIKDGLAWVAAGRSTHLDGGIHVLALRPETGELIHHLEPAQQGVHGLEDVLSSDGNRVYLRHIAMDKDGRVSSVAKGSSAQRKRKTDTALPAKTAAETAKAAAHADKHTIPETTDEDSPLALRAFSTAGLLDDSYFSRVGWRLGNVQGDLLVFDDQAVYCFRSRRQGGFGGWYQPASEAYQLVCQEHAATSPRWSITVPLCVRAMIATRHTLFVAGTADIVDRDDPWAAFEGRRGGRLLAYSLADGALQGEHDLPAPPAFDGLAAAAGRVYIACTDGKVRCYGSAANVQKAAAEGHGSRPGNNSAQ
jgi:outer membrane protein assembly factor BamB